MLIVNDRFTIPGMAENNYSEICGFAQEIRTDKYWKEPSKNPLNTCASNAAYSRNISIHRQSQTNDTIQPLDLRQKPDHIESTINQEVTVEENDHQKQLSTLIQDLEKTENGKSTKYTMFNFITENLTLLSDELEKKTGYNINLVTKPNANLRSTKSREAWQKSYKIIHDVLTTDIKSLTNDQIKPLVILFDWAASNLAYCTFCTRSGLKNPNLLRSLIEDTINNNTVTSMSYKHLYTLDIDKYLKEQHG